MHGTRCLGHVCTGQTDVTYKRKPTCPSKWAHRIIQTTLHAFGVIKPGKLI